MIESPAEFLDRNNIRWQKKGSEAVMDCHRCGKKNHLYMSLKTFLWQCKRCNASGNERVLKVDRGLQYDIRDPLGQSPEIKALVDLSGAGKPLQSANKITDWTQALLHSDKAQAARDYLYSRAIPLEIAERYWLGWMESPTGSEQSRSTRRRARRARQAGDNVNTPASEQTDTGWLVLPSFTEWDQLDRPLASSASVVKLRSVPPRVKAYWRLAGGESVLFAPTGINPKPPLLIVGGEIDALSCVIAGHRNTIASTTGESGWSDVWSAQLESVEDIVIIYDNDEAGRKGAAELSKRLGEWRCRIGAWPEPYNDANEALVALGGEFDIKSIIAEAKASGGDEIVRLSALRDDYLDYLLHGNPRGTSTGWEDLDLALGGVREGEVTVITGDTGSGKSTFTSHWVLNMASQGMTCLVCPFEMGSRKQLDKWVRQWAQTPPDEIPRAVLDKTLDGLVGLPIWMLNRYGSITIEAMRNTLFYAIRRLGVKFILIDHIHFMIDSGPNQYAELANMMKMLATVTQQTGAHIAVVAHPRQHSQSDEKHRDNRIIQMSDIKGASDIKQDADSILSIWRPRKADREGAISEDGEGVAMIYSLKSRSDYGAEVPVALKYVLKSARYEAAEEVTPTAQTSAPPLPPKRSRARGGSGSGPANPPEAINNPKHWTEVDDDLEW